MRSQIGLTATLTFSLALLLSACGGGSNQGGSQGGGGTPAPSVTHEWTWISGADDDTPTDNSDPVYGTQGVPSTVNVPGGRNSAVSWTDRGGNLWVFGGFGLDANVTNSALNDLWEFNPGSNQWTWVSGSSTAGTNYDALQLVYGQQGVYGALGTPAASNVPGGRANAVSWTDSAGNLWLFGGQGFDSIGAFGFLNDLWEFNPASKEWTWISGSSTVGATRWGQGGEYGTLGVAAAGNVPGSLWGAVSWTDSNGNLWLFGGNGPDLYGNPGNFNNLWEFNSSTVEWTWVSGAGGTNNNQPGVYGTQGTPSAANVPGGRVGAVSWIDHNGKLWLFGGIGGDKPLNDLWNFNPTSKEWTWVSGSNTSGQLGQYGTLGVPASSNVPGARQYANGWIDSNGNLGLFGGQGFDSSVPGGWLNDLWEFNPTSNEWTWMSGNSTGNQPGTYGVKGTPSVRNIPGGRFSATGWTDSNGDFWVFAGFGRANNPIAGGPTILNDLWRYQPN